MSQSDKGAAGSGASGGGEGQERFRQRRPPKHDPYFRNVPLFVTDQDRAVEFYRDKIGLQVLYDQTIQGLRWIAMASEKEETEMSVLLAPGEIPGNLVPELDPTLGRWSGITFLSSDINATARLWKSRGVTFETEPEMQPWGAVMARFIDPDGYHHHLVEPHNM